MSIINRRLFLQSSAAAGAAICARTAAGAADKPNDRIRIAVMGVRGRGRDLMRGFAAAARIRRSSR